MKGGILDKRTLQCQSSKRLPYVVLAAILCLCLAGMLAVKGTVLARADSLNLKQACSITVTMPPSEDMPTPPALVYDLYKVASAEASTGYDAYTFKKTPLFDGLSGDMSKMDSEAYKNAAQQALSIVQNSDADITPYASAKVGQTAKIPNGSTNLESGLYLVVVHGNNPSSKGEYIVSSDNSLKTIARSKTNVFSFSPELIAVPDRKLGTSNNTSNSTAPWNYNVSAVLKASWTPLYGSLEITKTLNTFDATNGKSATFLFNIEGVDDSGNVVYSNIVPIEFDGAKSETKVLDKIPGGATVTVKEVYSGADYKLVSSPEKTVKVVADETASVQFVNDYHGTTNSGGTIINSFEFQEGETDIEDTWNWVQTGDGKEQQ